MTRKATNGSRSNTMRGTNEPKPTADTDESSGSDGDDSKLFTDPAGQLGKKTTSWPLVDMSMNFAKVLLVDDGPKTYSEAIKSKDSAEWKSALDTKIRSLHRHDAWESIKLPPGKKAINNKWIYRIKHNPDGSAVMM